MAAEMPPCSNYGVAHVFVFGGVSMRPVSIADRLRGSSIVGVAVGSFGLAWSVRQTLSLSSANTRKFSPARMLLLLGITHCEQLDSGSHGNPDAADDAELHARGVGSRS